MVPNKELPTTYIPKLNCICFLDPESQRPAPNLSDQFHVAGRTREATRFRITQRYCAVKQTPQLQFCPSACPLLHRNLAICPNSERKMVSGKDPERSESFKIQIWVLCSTGKHTHTQKKPGKSYFKFFLEAKPRITPLILSFHSLATSF